MHEFVDKEMCKNKPSFEIVNNGFETGLNRLAPEQKKLNCCSRRVRRYILYFLSIRGVSSS